MYDPRYPYPPPPPPPPRPGFPVWGIVLIVVGAVGLVGVGGLVLVGGLVAVGLSQAAKEDAWDAGAPSATGTATATGTGTATATGTGTGADTQDAPDEPAPVATVAPAATPTSGSSGGSGKWFCNATGWARVCGFANVCNNQLFSGTGVGSTQFTASQSAKLACEGSMRARGVAGVCTPACHPM